MCIWVSVRIAWSDMLVMGSDAVYPRDIERYDLVIPVCILSSILSEIYDAKDFIHWPGVGILTGTYTNFTQAEGRDFKVTRIRRLK